MTATQMQYEFDVGYDFITNLEAPGIEPREVSTLLTKAQEELVLDILKNDSYKEFNKKVLNRLKTTEIISSSITTGPYPNSYWTDIDSEIFVVINDRLSFTTGSSHRYPNRQFTDVEVKPVDDDYYSANKDNPWKKPDYRLAWRLDYADSASSYDRKHVYIVESGTTIDSIYIHYYRKPEPIIVGDTGYVAGDGAIDGKNWVDYDGPLDLDCELDPLVHRNIVDRAIKLAYAALQEEKGSSFDINMFLLPEPKSIETILEKLGMASAEMVNKEE